MLPNAGDHCAVCTQSWESDRKTQMRNHKRSFKAKVAGQNKNSQLLGLFVFIYNTLFRCESTKGYRILKDKALKKTTLSEEFKICFKHGFGRQEAKCQLYRTLWLFLHQERTMTENHQVPLRFQFPALLRKHLSTTNSHNRKWQCVIFIFSLVSNIKRLLHNICGFSLSVKLYIVFQ